MTELFRVHSLSFLKKEFESQGKFQENRIKFHAPLFKNSQGRNKVFYAPDTSHKNFSKSHELTNGKYKDFESSKVNTLKNIPNFDKQKDNREEKPYYMRENEKSNVYYRNVVKGLDYIKEPKRTFIPSFEKIQGRKKHFITKVYGLNTVTSGIETSRIKKLKKIKKINQIGYKGLEFKGLKKKKKKKKRKSVSKSKNLAPVHDTLLRNHSKSKVLSIYSGKDVHAFGNLQRKGHYDPFEAGTLSYYGKNEDFVLKSTKKTTVDMSKSTGREFQTSWMKVSSSQQIQADSHELGDYATERITLRTRRGGKRFKSFDAGWKKMENRGIEIPKKNYNTYLDYNPKKPKRRATHACFMFLNPRRNTVADLLKSAELMVKTFDKSSKKKRHLLRKSI